MARPILGLAAVRHGDWGDDRFPGLFRRTGGRGILFSFMVLLLLGSLLSLGQAMLKQDALSSAGVHEGNAYKRVSDKFANIKNNSIVLTTNSVEKSIDERVLPISYDINSNRVSFTTDLPAREEKIGTYLENLNAFRIFLEDTNYSREFDSMNVDINTILPSTWGGFDANISFMLDPQCMEFSVLDLNSVEAGFVCGDYNYFSIIKEDLNITLDSSDDFNSVSCSFNGSAACFNDDFNAQNALPYISISIDSSDCFQCALSQTTVRGHYDPRLDSTFAVNCIGAGCVSPSFDANLSFGTAIRYSGSRVIVTIGFEFGTQIRGINFSDMNISVKDISFGVRRWKD